MAVEFFTRQKPLPTGINADTPNALPQTDNTASVVVQRLSYLEKYEARMEELERAKKEKRTAIVSTIHDYTTYIMAEFFTKEELETLHENIEALAYGQPELYKPIRSKPDNPIKSPALGILHGILERDLIFR